MGHFTPQLPEIGLARCRMLVEEHPPWQHRADPVGGLAHRYGEFLKFLRAADRQVPKGLEIHMILDKYETHAHANVLA